MLEGYKTWAGIIISILGTLGIGNIIGSENLSGIINGIVSLIGFVLAAYGNYKSHQKINNLKNNQ